MARNDNEMLYGKVFQTIFMRSSIPYKRDHRSESFPCFERIVRHSGSDDGAVARADTRTRGQTSLAVLGFSDSYLACTVQKNCMVILKAICLRGTSCFSARRLFRRRQ